jgi:hypothetical protein
MVDSMPVLPDGSVEEDATDAAAEPYVPFNEGDPGWTTNGLQHS